jgi:hypothetical protein
MPTCSSSSRKSSQALKQPEEVHMSDEDLEVLVTLDDPWYGPDEDTFHLKPDADWPFPIWGTME